jgi:hypothetical protein
MGFFDEPWEIKDHKLSVVRNSLIFRLTFDIARKSEASNTNKRDLKKMKNFTSSPHALSL